MSDVLARKRLKRQNAVIMGKKCSVALDFSDYRKEDFEQDMELFRMRNSPAWRIKSEIPPEIRKTHKRLDRSVIFYEEAYRAIAEGSPAKIDYQEFKIFSTELLARCLFTLLADEMREILDEAQQINLEAKVFGRDGARYLAAYDAENSDKGKIALDVSGTLMTGRIYAPYLYTGNPDLAYVDKTNIHELQHHVNREAILNQVASQRKVARFANKREGAKSASVLYDILTGLHLEGIAEFVEKRNRPDVSIDANHAQRLISLLRDIAAAKSTREAGKIYDKGFCPDCFTGQYYLGFLMCYTIGLSVLKQRRNGGIVRVTAPEKINVPFDTLDDYIREKREVRLEQLDDVTRMATRKEISGFKHYTEFLSRYFQACEELGFKEPVAVMTPALFEELKKDPLLFTEPYGSRH